MKINIIAIGNKMPSWVQASYGEYSKRLPDDCKLNLIEIPLLKQGKNPDLKRSIKYEEDKILTVISPKNTVIALDVKGKQWDTPELARHLKDWQQSGNDIDLVIGGPDGLSKACLARATTRWSLSHLTLPHPLVRIVLAEQLYRAWTILKGHPYHRS
jgi:23S rRNA (pseudouridine1915-N3)-methyltransferase